MMGYIQGLYLFYFVHIKKICQPIFFVCAVFIIPAAYGDPAMRTALESNTLDLQAEFEGFQFRQFTPSHWKHKQGLIEELRPREQTYIRKNIRVNNQYLRLGDIITLPPEQGDYGMGGGVDIPGQQDDDTPEVLFNDKLPWAYPGKGGSISSGTLDDAAEEMSNNPDAKNFVDYLKSDPASKECDKAINVYVKNRVNKNTVDDYLDKCGVKMWNSSALSIAERLEIESRLGVIVNASNKGFCSGFIFEGNTVLTARHCLKNGITQGEAHFRLLAFPKQLISITKVHDTACGNVHKLGDIETVQACDYAQLEVDVYPLPAFSAMDSLLRFKQLYLVGYNRFKHFKEVGGKPNDLALVSSRIKKYIDDWDKGMVVSQSPTCSSYEIKEIEIDTNSAEPVKSTCFMHSCQSIEGMSGTPIFARMSNKLAFVGIHLGSNVLPGHNNDWVKKGFCNMSTGNNKYKATNIALAYKRK